MLKAQGEQTAAECVVMVAGAAEAAVAHPGGGCGVMNESLSSVWLPVSLGLLSASATN